MTFLISSKLIIFYKFSKIEPGNLQIMFWFSVFDKSQNFRILEYVDIFNMLPKVPSFVFCSLHKSRL